MTTGTLLIIWTLALMSPGLDFAIVTRNTLQKGRSAGLWTCVGIVAGLWLHLLLTFLVLAKAEQSRGDVVTVVMSLGGAYLMYIGVSSLRAAFGSKKQEESASVCVNFSFYRHPVFQGFLTNILNPKVSLLSISLFSGYLKTHSLSSMWGLFVFLSVISGGWFVLLAMVWAMAWVKRLYGRYQSLIEAIVGFGFVALALEIFWTVFQSL